MTWETLSTREVARAGGAVVRCDVVRGPSGEAVDYVVLDSPPISLVVPLLADGRVVLVRQFRYAWRQATWECPAGHADPGETPEATARRELAEETGYEARTLARLGELYASARTSGRFTLFVGRDLTPGRPRPDADEDVTARAFTPAEVRAMIDRGEVLHGPSLAALLLAERERAQPSS